MYDNKIRLSQDVLEKAALIASEWGLKNPRAAVEAVFRRYADEYLYGSHRQGGEPFQASRPLPPAPSSPSYSSPANQALEELDELLGL